MLKSQLTKNYDKYQTGGKICTHVMEKVIAQALPDTSLNVLCKLGDRLMHNELGKVFVGTDKGISFPTCVSVNEMVGHYSPINDDIILNDGDLVKIELGVHIDGFPSVLCKTVLIKDPEQDQKQYTKQENVLNAVTEATELAIRMMKPIKTNKQVSELLNQVAKKYNVSLLYVNNIDKKVPGVMSYQMSKNNLDEGNEEFDENDDIHTIILSRNNETYNFGMCNVGFEENEVFCLDIAMSSGTGKINCGNYPPNVFKKTNKIIPLKLASSKQVLNHFRNKHFPVVGYEILETLSPAKCKIGLKECLSKGLITTYDPYYEKKGEYIARIKSTVVVKKKPKVLTK